MSKFTPGPWHAGADARIVYDAAGWAIANAITFHGKHGAHDAYGNGRLIAAAPDLLAMLAEAHDTFGHDYEIVVAAGASAGIGLNALPPVRPQAMAAMAAVASSGKH